MNRKKKLAINTMASLIKQFVSIICAFILPRLFLTHYGSEVNGLVSSITQFLGLISIFDAGMGVVIEASLYKPLAQKNSILINQVLSSGQSFYRKFVALLAIYTIILACIFPFLPGNNFDFFYIFTLVLAISISSFGQYGIGVTNSVLLSADQKSYLNFAAYAITNIVNTILGVVLINLNCSVQVVKLASSLVFLIRPLFLAYYVKKHYLVNWHEKYTEEPIKQKWNGFAQHIAALVVANTDIVVLTVFSTLRNVSIYSVYFLVINSIKEIVNASSAGIKSLIGDMLAKKEILKLENTFSFLEWSMHIFIVFLFSMTATLIVPFIMIYTRGVNDANYNVPTFAILLSIAYAIYCLRIPYFTVIQAAGHFKETQKSSIIEALINIVVSVVTVFHFGLIGVACGTIVAMTYRLLYLVWYLSRNIIQRSMKLFYKQMCADVLIFAIVINLTKIIELRELSYLSWIITIGPKAFLAMTVILVINLILYNRQMISFCKNIKVWIKKKNY